MKKYYQLMLVLVSVVSLVSLIIYRHEYNRLRYVLEVFSIFGKPSDVEINKCTSLENVTVMNDVYNIPVPAWQTIGDGYYVYSAFWDKSKGNVQAMAITSTSSIPSMMCNIWFANHEKPQKGKFSYLNLQSAPKKSKFRAVVFYCTVQKNFGTPFKVTFYNNSNTLTPATSVPIWSNQLLTDGTGGLICVKPDDSTRKPTQIVEFLNFYQVLGVKKFIIYDNGHMFPSLINAITGLHITILPWNIPFNVATDVVQAIIETDCVMRVKYSVDSVAIVNWNELIVPRQHASLSSLIIDADPSGDINKFQMIVQDFCIDYEDNENKPKTQIIFHKLYYRNNDEAVIPIVRINKYNNNNILSTKTLNINEAVLQRYVKCFDKIKTNKLERSSTILKFNTDFVKTILYRLWVTDKLPA